MTRPSRCFLKLPTALAIAVFIVLCGLTATAEEPEETTNPYLAGEGLSATELADFLERMQRKPATIRSRPGFQEALLDAADRLLAAEPTEKQQTSALVVKFEVLRARATQGDQKAAAALEDLAVKFAADERPSVAQPAR